MRWLNGAGVPWRWSDDTVLLHVAASFVTGSAEALIFDELCQQEAAENVNAVAQSAGTFSCEVGRANTSYDTVAPSPFTLWMAHAGAFILALTAAASILASRA